LPDSAKSRYYYIIAEKAITTARKDSLLVKLSNTQTTLDSLLALVAVMGIPATPDTLAAEIEIEDSLKVALNDSLKVTLEDSLKVILDDSLMVTLNDNLPDSLMAVPDSLNPQAAIQAQIQQLQTDITSLENRISRLDENLLRFDDQIIPFCLFAIGSVLHDYSPESSENAEILARMESSHPENKYTRALSALQNGQEVRLIDPAEERQEKRLEELFGQISAQPDSAVTGLAELSTSMYPAIKLAANYRLGWYYSFEAVDTLSAKPYLDSVLENTAAEEYTTITRRFYNGTSFLLFEKPKADSVAADTLSVVPSPKEWALPAPFESWESLPDSLKMYQIIPPLVDSLSSSLQQHDSPEPDQPKEIDEPIATPESPIPDLEKKEESPLE